MKAEIRTFVIDTCCWVVTISIIFFFFTLWLFSYNNIDEPLKESWSNTVSLLSALATIGAAIIASRLFQNWKTQHSFTEQIKVLSLMLDRTSEIQELFWQSRVNDTLIEIILGLPYEKKFNISFTKQQEKFELIISKLHSLHKLENQIYMLNNTKKEYPVFNGLGKDDPCPIFLLVEFMHDSMIAASTLNASLIEKQAELIEEQEGLAKHNITQDQLDVELEPGYENLLTHKTFDFTDPYLVDNIQKLLSRGDLYLRLTYPSLSHLKENLHNEKVTDWFKQLDKQIMNYRDKLDYLD